MKAALQILKKHLISIILGVVAVLAVVAKFWPLAGMYTALQNELNQRLTVERQVDSLLNMGRHMPVLSPDQTDQTVLDVFPTQEVIDAGKAAAAQVTKQADQLVQAAVQRNLHAPLFPNELPKPDDSTKYSFAQKYIAETTNYSRWQEVLNSCAHVSPAEVATRQNDIQTQIYAQYGVVPGGPGGAALATAQDQFKNATLTLKSDMDLERAQKFSIYLEPGALPSDPNIGIGAGKPPPDAGQIWDAQLQMWIVDDITGAIARINRDFSDPAEPNGPPVDNILHSPIKEIEALQGINPITGPGADLTAGVGGPTPVEPTLSPTGRVCNGLYNVYRFDLRLDVDAEKIPQVLHELQLGQFITVLNVQILEVVDPAQAVFAGFRFGDKPVVRLEIDGEILLMENWTADLLPDSRKAGTPGGLPSGASSSGTPSNQEQDAP